MAAPKGKSTQPDRHPTTRGEVWVHIDRFDKPNGRVWALQYLHPRTGRPVYLTATDVQVLVWCHTRQHLTDGRQPKAYLVACPARVRWHRSVAIVERLPPRTGLASLQP